MKKLFAAIIINCILFNLLCTVSFAQQAPVENFAINFWEQHSSYDDEAEQKRLEIVNTDSVVKLTTSPYNTTFYISPDGDDSADGKSPATAWKTTANLYQYSWFSSGDVVLFERGGIFHNAHFTMMNGLSYGAYGKGAKPALYGSAKNYSDRSLWTQTQNANVWSIQLDSEITNIGNIVFDNGKMCGIYRKENSLQRNYQFWEDKTNHVLYLYLSNGNPADIHSDIEICDGRNILSAGPNKNIRVDNLCLRYTGAHGMSFGDGGENVKITNCEVGYIGGSELVGFANFVRYGNGIEFYGNSNNSTVENCWVYQCYDAGLTNQGSNSVISNLTFKGNLVEYCQYGIEIWVGDEALKYNGSTASDNSRLVNCVYEDNILRFAGYNFEYNNRYGSNTSAAACITAFDFYLPCDGNTVIRNNVFDTGYRYLVSIVKPNSAYGPKIVGNTWITNDFSSDESNVMGNLPTAAGVGQTRTNNDRANHPAGNRTTMEESVAVFDTAPKSIVYDGDKYKYCHEIGEDWVVKKEASCREVGERVKECIHCGKVFESEELPMVDHTEVIDKAVAPSCSAAGKSEGSHCAVCGEILTAQTAVAALPHTTATKNKKAATHFEKGHTGDEVCTVCGEVVKAGKAIAKKAVKVPVVKVKKVNNKIVVTCKTKTKLQVKYKIGKKTVIKKFNKKVKTATVKNLKNGKYKVWVRAVMKKANKTAYSKWTKPKTVRIKK